MGVFLYTFRSLGKKLRIKTICPLLICQLMAVFQKEPGFRKKLVDGVPRVPLSITV